MALAQKVAAAADAFQGACRSHRPTSLASGSQGYFLSGTRGRALERTLTSIKEPVLAAALPTVAVALHSSLFVSRARRARRLPLLCLEWHSEQAVVGSSTSPSPRRSVASALAAPELVTCRSGPAAERRLEKALSGGLPFSPPNSASGDTSPADRPAQARPHGCGTCIALLELLSSASLHVPARVRPGRVVFLSPPPTVVGRSARGHRHRAAPPGSHWLVL